jgi:hypothetical protein
MDLLLKNAKTNMKLMYVKRESNIPGFLNSAMSSSIVFLLVFLFLKTPLMFWLFVAGTYDPWAARTFQKINCR